MDPLVRATAYPYAAPAHSYVLTEKGVVALGPGASCDLDGRTPVLAVGSNRAPEQLVRKFAPLGGRTLPVTTARLFEFDSVYAAHFTRYGAIPATLQHSPGTVANLAVTWLDEAQLARMHATEAANYRFGVLAGIRLETGGGVFERVHAYLSRHGCLSVDGAPLALAAIAAFGRRFAAATEAELLERMRARLAPRQGLAAFIGTTIADEGTRAAYTRAIARKALPFTYAGYTAIVI